MRKRKNLVVNLLELILIKNETFRHIKESNEESTKELTKKSLIDEIR